MDYEELYRQMQTLEKSFRDKLIVAQRSFKNLSKNSEKGDIKSLSKDLAQMRTFIEDYESVIDEYDSLISGFDAKEYMVSGDFAKQIVEYCENLSVNINGEYPVYEMFPYKVKIDSENQELYINRKKLQCVRPSYFVNSIKQSLYRLNNANFNASGFLNELAEAYDAISINKGKNGKDEKDSKAEYDILLKDLYNYLVPMQRFRREYDMQSFAFDLARLHSSDIESTKDGRGFEFGPSRFANKLIRILDKDGKERHIGTIRFFAL